MNKTNHLSSFSVFFHCLDERILVRFSIWWDKSVKYGVVCQTQWHFDIKLLFFINGIVKHLAVSYYNPSTATT